MTAASSLATSDPALLEFAELVGDAGPVAVEGARTRWALGGELADDVRLVTAPTGIVNYEPAEMTVCVRAGTTTEELRAVLAESGQRTALPLRGGTVGGAIVVGENDYRALGRGVLRTAPLQIRYISAEGKVVTSGGPTVKNVSGFDLPRLMVGSLGTLGLLAEVTIRTNPIPPVQRWLKADDAGPQQTLDALLAPSSVLWDGTNTFVELEGHGADVDAQQRALSTVGTFAETDGPPLFPPHRWSLSPAELLEGNHADGGPFLAAVGLGLAFSYQPQPDRPVDRVVEELNNRVKQNFDPTGRLNPGRNPARK